VPGNVGHRAKSGKLMLVLSLTAFDPEPKSVLDRESLSDQPGIGYAFNREFPDQTLRSTERGFVIFPKGPTMLTRIRTVLAVLAGIYIFCCGLTFTQKANAAQKNYMKTKHETVKNSFRTSEPAATIGTRSINIRKSNVKRSYNRNSLGTEMKVNENVSEDIRNTRTKRKSGAGTQSRVLRTLREMRGVGAAGRGM
jgi:hypothetical protein